MAQKRILIQAGHQNCQYNSIEILRRSTGAPNEMSFNVDIRDKVSDELRKRGFEVQGTDANINDNPTLNDQDWDLFLSVHYDADVYNTGGGFVDFPEPSTDGATQESQRIQKVLSDEYFTTTKIVKHQERSNDNTRYYYAWKYMTLSTPCVLIECGVGMHVPDDHSTLHFNRPLVVEGIVRGICKAFSVKYEIDNGDDCQTKLKNMEVEKNKYQSLYNDTNNKYQEAKTQLDKSSETMTKATQTIENLTKVINLIKDLVNSQ